MPEKVLIIAEAGVNHNGRLETAMQLVEAAAQCGADAVKFQLFHASELVCSGAELAPYQKDKMPGNETQLTMLRRLELSYDDILQIAEQCRKWGIMFLSSAFDVAALDVLDLIGVRYLKVPSGEVVNLPLLREVGRRRRPVILSTGMATLGEVEKAVDILRQAGTEEIILLHCTTSYPTPPEEANLRAMLTLKKAFGCQVGYSDHTAGTGICLAAVAMGAGVIEKHLTLDRTMEGPDHKASLEPGVFRNMVEDIRDIEQALGDGIKRPTASELQTMTAVRRSLVASRDIKAGELLSVDNLVAKRPLTGISVALWDVVIGRTARCDIRSGTVITWDMV